MYQYKFYFATSWADMIKYVMLQKCLISSCPVNVYVFLWRDSRHASILADQQFNPGLIPHIWIQLKNSVAPEEKVQWCSLPEHC